MPCRARKAVVSSLLRFCSETTSTFKPPAQGEERSEPWRHALPRPKIQLPRGPTHTIRTAVACSISDGKPTVLGPTAHACRSHLTCPARRRPTRFLVRPRESRGPPREQRYSPSARGEPPSAGTHSNITRIRSNHMRLGTHALSLHPPLRAQMSAVRRVRGRAELALRRRCVGCPSGGAAPRAKGCLVVASVPQALDRPHQAAHPPGARALARARACRPSATLDSG